MTAATANLLNRLLLFFFVVFAAASTFSIALAQSALGIALLLFVVVCIKDHFQPFVAPLKWVWLFIALYVVWLLLACLFGVTPLKSVLIAKEEWLFLIIPITVFLARDPRHRRLLTTAFACGVGIVALYGVVQAFTGVAWRFEHGRFLTVALVDVRGNFDNSMTFANFYVTAGCFLLGLGVASDDRANWRRKLYLGAGLLAIVATILALRRGAIAAAVLSIILLAFQLRSKRRWLLVGLSAAMVALVLISPGLQWRFGEKVVRDLGTASYASRVYIWERSLDIVEHHPVFGIGQGNFYDEYVARLPQDVPDNYRFTHAHNDFLNVAAIAGIPGALFFTGIWLVVLHFLWHGHRNARFTTEDRAFCLAALFGSVAFLVTSMIEATFADEEVRQMLMFVWAIGLVAWYNRSDKVTQTA